MGATRLEISGRTLVRCDNGPLNAEYALFDPADIELKATEPGSVREIGYRVAVGKARARLAHAGVDMDLVRDAAEALRPIAATYARGRIVRRVVRHFSATELFEGRTYDAERGAYDGAWLDTAALAENLDVADAAISLQAIHLASILEDAPEDAVAMLHTLELAREKRPGHRTHKKPKLTDVAKVPAAIRALAQTKPTAPPEREAGPARVEVLETIGERRKWLTNASARLVRIEQAANARDQPTKGPLADAELWALERQMSDGSADGALEKLDALERAGGRTPATTYLRARAALMCGREDPAKIAARVSALALSMASFAELHLLAAQAWLAAGDGRRALPYARDIADDATVDPELRARAEALSVDATAPPVLGPLSGKPIVPIDEQPPDTRIEPAPVVAVTRNPTVEAALSVPLPPSRRDDDNRARPSTVPPSLDASRRSSAPYREIGERRPSKRPRTAEPHSSEEEDAPPREESIAAAPPETVRYMAGASQPPFGAPPTRTEDRPTPAVPRPPAVPRLSSDASSEAAEYLGLPHGAGPEPPRADQMPRTVGEARALFTLLSRELGREYRMKRGVELRTDANALEAMQAHLFETYYGKDVRSLDDWLDVRRHGAFLSEILVRTLGAEWVDIAAGELGYWAMALPHTGTRVWPFARVLRYVAMGPKERDLVSYYLELKSR